jgi:hypothetical protein
MIPAFPEVPPEQTIAVTSGPLRYEDVSQDGRLLLTALPHFMGQAVFQGLMVKVGAARVNAHAGILPILTRLTIEGHGGPVSIRKPIAVRGGYQLAHTVDESGAVNRLQLIAFASMSAPIGRTNPPKPPNDGQPISVGSVIGEHVFTRLFAPPAERKITRFAPGPWPEVPETRVGWRTPESLLELPEGATAIDEALAPDDVAMVFGLVHTDANHHVNSLAYPRLFEEATLRRLAAHGRDLQVLARFVETAYRKPCFAGQRMRILLRLYERDGRSGAVGVFVPDEDRGARPHTVVRIEMG